MLADCERWDIITEDYVPLVLQRYVNLWQGCVCRWRCPWIKRWDSPALSPLSVSLYDLRFLQQNKQRWVRSQLLYFTKATLTCGHASEVEIYLDGLCRYSMWLQSWLLLPAWWDTTDTSCWVPNSVRAISIIIYICIKLTDLAVIVLSYGHLVGEWIWHDLIFCW